VIDFSVTTNADQVADAFRRAPAAIADGIRDALSADGAADVSGGDLGSIAATMLGSRLAGHLVAARKDGKFIVLPSMSASRPVVGFFAAARGDDVLGRVARAIDRKMADVGLPTSTGAL